jgi:hypothetical protein
VERGRGGEGEKGRGERESTDDDFAVDCIECHDHTITRKLNEKNKRQRERERKKKRKKERKKKEHPRYLSANHPSNTHKQSTHTHLREELRGRGGADDDF